MNTLTILFGGRRERRPLSPPRYAAGICDEGSNCPDDGPYAGPGTWIAIPAHAAVNEAHSKVLATGIFGLAH